MPSSGYTAISFVANEQPTTAKWNLIGSNDSSFNLGTGLEDNTILARHIAAGVVDPTKLGTPACFSLYHNANQSVTNGAFNVIQFNSELFDTVNGHSTVSSISRFTIPTGYAGKWLFTTGIDYAAAGGATRIAAFYKNGAVYNGKRETVSGANTYMAEHTKIIDVAVSDYIEVAGYQDSGGTLNVQGAGMPGLDITMFDGVYLGKT